MHPPKYEATFQEIVDLMLSDVSLIRNPIIVKIFHCTDYQSCSWGLVPHPIECTPSQEILYPYSRISNHRCPCHSFKHGWSQINL